MLQGSEKLGFLFPAKKDHFSKSWDKAQGKVRKVYSGAPPTCSKAAPLDGEARNGVKHESKTWDGAHAPTQWLRARKRWLHSFSF